MSFSITWHGHATLSLDIDGSKVVVDPFFTGNPVAVTEAASVSAEYVLLTHGHADHIGDALAIAQRCDSLVISNYEICSWIAAQGHENVHAQHIGGGYQHPIGRVKLTIAFHGSGLPDGSYGGMPAGFLLEAGGKRVYIAGDTALYSDMSLIGQGGYGAFILRGLRRDFLTEILVGVAFSVLLAVLLDLFFLYLERRISPWAHRRLA